MKGFIVLNYLKFIYRFKRNSLDIKEISDNSYVYYYLNKKYRKFLDSLPIYKGSKERENTIRWCRLQ